MKKKKLAEAIVSMIMPALFLIVWTIAAERISRSAVLPSIGLVLDNFINAFDNFIGLGSIPRNIIYSLVRVILGYFLGCLIAVPLGLLMGYFRPVRIFLENFLVLFKPIPAIAWQPLVLGWFGVGSIARLLHMQPGPNFAVWDNFKISMIFLIALGTFYPVWANVMFGVSTVRKNYIESVRVLGATEQDIFLRVLIPAAMPNMINGLRMGLTSAWICLVSAEMLPGSMCGVGYLITHAYELARMDLVITGMICIGLIGALLDGIFRIISDRCFAWFSQG